MDTAAATFAATGLTLYASHHVGDYWVQTERQSRRKGLAGAAGRRACLAHVLTYLATQGAALLVLVLVLDIRLAPAAVLAGLAVSGLTHYAADRRERGLMVRLARALPFKRGFLSLGVPRPGRDDNPSLGTGGWALDQSWHIFWGVFVAALIVAALSVRVL